MGDCSAALLLGVALLFGRSVQAQSEGPTLLSYRAPSGCPEAADFQKSVLRRSSRVRFVDEGSHEREVSITLTLAPTKEAATTVGELRLIEHDGSLRQRSVRFSSCAEAVEGLALITVVSLDPQALIEAPPAPEPAAAKPAVVEPRPTRPTRPTPASSSAPRASSSGVETAIGAQFVAAFHELPRTALGGALFADVAPAASSWFAPSLRLALSHSERRGVSVGNAQANFALTLATLSACPLRIGDSAISLRPCAFTSAGVLRAWSSDRSDPHPRTRPFWAWGGSLQIGLRVSQDFEIATDLELGSTLIRDRFELAQASLGRTSALYLSSGAGLRFVFR